MSNYRWAVAPCSLAALCVALAIVTWDRLGDLLIDYPHELYSAWLVAVRGWVPYQDFFYVYGPLPLAVNALAFHLLGVHNQTIQGINLAWAALACARLWRILAQAWSQFQASLAVAAFLVLSVFSALPLCTNFNFIAPYTHAVPVGMALALTCLATLFAGLASKNSRGAAPAATLSGPCCVLVGLTKPEIAVACWIRIAVTLLGATYLNRRFRYRLRMATTARFLLWGALIATMLCISVAAYFYNPSKVFQFLGAGFLAISPHALGGIRQRFQMGFDTPWENLTRCIVCGIAGLGILFAALGLGILAKGQGMSRHQEKALIFLVSLPFPVFATLDPELAKVVMLRELP